MDQLEHLKPATKEIAILPDSQRIYAIRAGTWVGYPRAKQALAKMEELLAHPPITRMPNMLLVAQPFNGKSSVLERFMSLHAPEVDPEKESNICPVVLIEAPPKPDISDLYIRILDFLGAPYKSKTSPGEACSQVKRLFRAVGVRLLMIDEIHHLIAGSTKKQQEFRNALKSLGNETKISMVVAGTHDAHNAFNTDPQMTSRFPPFELPLWKTDQKFGSLLATLELRLPLRRPSTLKNPQLMQAIHDRAEGTLGDTCDLLKELAIDAIKTKTEQITLDQVGKLSWIPPSKRKEYRRS